VWKEREHILTEPEKTFSGFSVFNKDISRSPVEPYGTRPSTPAAKDYFYQQNKMTETTNVPAAVSSGVQSAFTTGLLIASPPVGFGMMIGKGAVEYSQGIGILSGNAGTIDMNMPGGIASNPLAEGKVWLLLECLMLGWAWLDISFMLVDYQDSLQWKI